MPLSQLTDTETHSELDNFFALTLNLWCVISADGMFLRLNRQWEDLLGYDLDGLQGRSLLDYLHPDDLTATLAALTRLQMQGTVLDFSNRCRCNDGSFRHLEWRAQAHGDTIYATALDITARIALEAQDAHYQAIVTTLTEGVIMRDHEGRIQTCNPAAERILGLTREQVIGRSSFDLVWPSVHEDYSPFTWETYPGVIALQTGQPVGNVVMGVHKPDGDGSYTWILLNTQPLFHPGETQPYGVVVSFTDITQVRNLKAERERMALLNEFITNTSHELRTPLAIIATSTYLMARSDDKAVRQQKGEQVDREIAYLSTIIDQLHQVARLDRLTDFESVAIGLYDLVSEVVLSYPVLRVEMIDSTAADRIRIDGSPTYIAVALRHLLANAVRFSDDDSPIMVRMARVDREVVVDVIDHGVGIAEEHLDRVFEHFYKVDSARARTSAGAGMGLTIVKRIMQLHSGRVTAQSEVGSGTIIHLHFPALDE
ncbi:MAG: PAS domain S-box protein [Chloroflexota bacterium]|nr:PAS domain S-box protein [Chloroflexota bacterium]